MERKTLLLTGFGPYAKTLVNPAEQLVNALAGKIINNITIIPLIVPNVFFGSIECVKQQLMQHQPDYVIMMGEYVGRSMITLERYAYNLIDSSRYGLSDNNGVSYDSQLTAEDGPVAYQSTVPIKAMVAAMRHAGTPADISDTPGTFVCNHLFYGILHEIAIQKLVIRAGWVHLPMLPKSATEPENLGLPSMSTETAMLGLAAAIKALVHHPSQDIFKASSRFQI